MNLVYLTGLLLLTGITVSLVEYRVKRRVPGLCAPIFSNDIDHSVADCTSYFTGHPV